MPQSGSLTGWLDWLDATDKPKTQVPFDRLRAGFRLVRSLRRKSTAGLRWPLRGLFDQFTSFPRAAPSPFASLRVRVCPGLFSTAPSGSMGWSVVTRFSSTWVGQMPIDTQDDRELGRRRSIATNTKPACRSRRTLLENSAAIWGKPRSSINYRCPPPPPWPPPPPRDPPPPPLKPPRAPPPPLNPPRAPPPAYAPRAPPAYPPRAAPPA